MADTYTPNLNLREPQVGAASDTWGGIPGLNGDMQTIDAVFNPDGLSPIAPTFGPFAGVPGVGLRIGVGKVLNIEGSAVAWADRFTLYDLTDDTKSARFNLSAVLTGTLAVFTTPPASDTLVGIAATQTLTNKTLTAPVIHGGSVDGATTGVANSTPTDASPQLATDGFVQAAIAAAIAAIPAPDQPLSGDVRLTYRQTAATGWLFLDDSTIGNTGSGAVHAGAQYQNLFTVLWAIPACTVIGGKGASAAADWTAARALTLAKVLGRALGVAGAGSSLTARNVGDIVGEEAHQLITGEIPAHAHALTTPAVGAFIAGGGFAGGGSAGGEVDGTTNTGGGGAHNNMQPTSWLNAEIKL